TIWDGIPVTAVPRALLDYAEQVDPPELRHALDEADRRELISRAKMKSMLARNPGRRGSKALKAELAEMAGTGRVWTQSELRREVLALCRQRGLPEPQTEADVYGYRVDLCWPQHRLVVE